MIYLGHRETFVPPVKNEGLFSPVQLSDKPPPSLPHSVSLDKYSETIRKINSILIRRPVWPIFLLTLTYFLSFFGIYLSWGNTDYDYHRLASLILLGVSIFFSWPLQRKWWWMGFSVTSLLVIENKTWKDHHIVWSLETPFPFVWRNPIKVSYPKPIEQTKSGDNDGIIPRKTT